MVEFPYNKSYHSCLDMTPFEVLYGRNCHTSISWDRVEDIIIVGPKMLKEMEEKMILVCS